MNVTIIGAGNMGKGIGYRIAAGGHSITLVDSNPEAAENLREELHSVMRKGATISTAVGINQLSYMAARHKKTNSSDKAYSRGVCAPA